MTAYCAAACGAVTLIAGAVMAAKGTTMVLGETTERYHQAIVNIKYWKQQIAYGEEAMKSGWNMSTELEEYRENLAEAQKIADSYKKWVVTKMGTAGRWMMGIGGALMVGAAIVKAVQLAIYYRRWERSPTGRRAFRTTKRTAAATWRI